MRRVTVVGLVAGLLTMVMASFAAADEHTAGVWDGSEFVGEISVEDADRLVEEGVLEFCETVPTADDPDVFVTECVLAEGQQLPGDVEEEDVEEEPAAPQIDVEEEAVPDAVDAGAGGTADSGTGLLLPGLMFGAVAVASGGTLIVMRRRRAL